MPEPDQSSAAFHLSEGAHIGKIEIRGPVAGRDVVMSAATPADAAAAHDREQLLNLVVQLQQQVAALDQAPVGLKDDAADELRKAHEAGQQGDSQRFSEKLQSATSYLERLGQTLPAAIALAQTVAAVAQRATGLW